LTKLLADTNTLKIFHFGRFDLGVLYQALGVMAAPVYCTKIASRLARTYTDKHGLKDLVRELLGVDLSKQQQLSDWGSAEWSDAQVAYAASDVLHLHALKAKLDGMLAREGRTALADACFRFLPERVRLDLAGWAAEDIFSHSRMLLRSWVGSCVGLRQTSASESKGICRGGATFAGDLVGWIC